MPARQSRTEPISPRQPPSRPNRTTVATARQWASMGSNIPSPLASIRALTVTARPWHQMPSRSNRQRCLPADPRPKAAGQGRVQHMQVQYPRRHLHGAWALDCHASPASACQCCELDRCRAHCSPRRHSPQVPALALARTLARGMARPTESRAAGPGPPPRQRPAGLTQTSASPLEATCLALTRTSRTGLAAERWHCRLASTILSTLGKVRRCHRPPTPRHPTSQRLPLPAQSPGRAVAGSTLA